MNDIERTQHGPVAGAYYNLPLTQERNRNSGDCRALLGDLGPSQRRFAAGDIATESIGRQPFDARSESELHVFMALTLRNKRVGFHKVESPMQILLVAVAFFAIFPVTQISHATTFYGSAGTGRVIDAATGLPIEGVIVEASWKITNLRDPAGPALAELRHADTESNAKGDFTFPEWGPASIDLHSSLRSVWKVLDYSQPTLHLYKRGYHGRVVKGPSEDPRPFWNQLRLSGEDVRPAWWNQHEFGLEPSLGPLEQRREELSLAMTALANCRWVFAPRIAGAYIKEAMQLEGADASFVDPVVAKLLAESCPKQQRPLTTYLN